MHKHTHTHTYLSTSHGWIFFSWNIVQITDEFGVFLYRQSGNMLFSLFFSSIFKVSVLECWNFISLQGFITDHGKALEELFGHGAENSCEVNTCLNVMAQRIATVFASLKVSGDHILRPDPSTHSCHSSRIGRTVNPNCGKMHHRDLDVPFRCLRKSDIQIYAVKRKFIGVHAAVIFFFTNFWYYLSCWSWYYKLNYDNPGSTSFITVPYRFPATGISFCVV